MRNYSSKTNLTIWRLISVCPVIPALVACLSGYAHADSFGTGTVSLSMRDVVERVERENLQVLLNREGVEEALQEVYRQRAGLIPTVRLNMNQTRSQFVNVGRGFDAPGASPVTRPSSRFETTLQGNINVLNTNLIAAYRSARLGLELSELQYETLLQDILESALASYLIHLRNISAMEVIRANIDRNQSLLDLARDRLASGVATQIDVTRAEVALARSEQDRIQQQTALLESELRLKRLLNIDLDIPMELQSVAQRLEEEAAPRLARLPLESILENRTDYQAALQSKRLSEIARRAAIWQRVPDINIFANYGVVSNEAFSGNYHDAWSAGIQLTLPVFDGFRIRSDRLLAESAIRSQELRIRNLEQQLGSEYRLQVQLVRSTFDQISVARKSLELSQRELDLATTRFERGVADNREVIDAQNNLAFAESNFLESLYSYGLARLGLARVLGRVQTIVELEDGA